MKIFPYGINGYNTERDLKVTASAYAKARMMSSDTRYQNNEYMFYLLAKIEAEKITSKINICSSRLKANNNRVNNLHVYMKNLRGYSSYWNSIKSDLMAFLRNLGEPTWFITLSARDLEWPDMINALLYAKHSNYSKRSLNKFVSQVSNLDFKARSKLLHDHPVVAARQFSRRFNALMKYLKKNDKILGGKIIDYWYRVEFQKRGSPHIHMLVWIKDAPAFNTPEGVQFIDNICTCNIPTDPKLRDLVLKLQTHRCTQTCYKTLINKTKKKCRFGYKLPVAEQTRILTEDELPKNNNKFCIFKRKEEEKSINVYNLELLIIWNANMDIQPVGTLYGIAYYVSKYVAKEEPQHIQEEIKDAMNNIQNAPQAQFAQQLHKASKLIMKHRERSAQEAAFILCGLRLKACSRQTVFVNSLTQNKRMRMIRKEMVYKTHYSDGDYCENIIEKYEKRHSDLNNICLAEYATEYEFYKSKINLLNEDSDSNVDEFLEEDEINEINNRRIYQQIDSELKIRRRLKTAILKTPYSTVNDDPEQY